MVTKTTNLKLNKPEGTDVIDISVLNANMDILDEAVPSKVDKVAGKQLSTEDYTTAEKTKLGGIADGAQVNVIEGVTVNGSAVPVTGKTADVTVPTKVSDLANDADYAKVSQIPTKVSTLQNDADYAKVSQIPTKVGDLTNDSGFITKAVADLANYYVKTDTYTRSEVLELVNAIPKFTVTVVDSLPASGDSATIYFVPVEGKGQNVHDEYIWVNGAWEQIGSTAFELDITQDASGIKINGTALQGASATQDGLLTKGAYATFNAKQPAGDYLARDADGYTRGKLWFDAETWFSKPINIGAGTYKIDTNGQAILSWIKLAGTTDLNAVPPKYPVLRNDGWIYSRTLAEMITDLGIDGKQPAGDYALRSEIPDISGKADKSEIPDISGLATKTELTTGLAGKQPTGDYAYRSEIPSIAGLATEEYVNSKVSSVYRVMGSCTTAQLASKAKTKGDVWNLTDAGSYGPIGTNVVYTGTEWDALAGTFDPSGLATKGEVQTAQSKADSAYDLANGKASQSDLTALASRVTALENIPNANGRSY